MVCAPALLAEMIYMLSAPVPVADSIQVFSIMEIPGDGCASIYGAVDFSSKSFCHNFVKIDVEYL
jgi:hypothetical protein